MVGKLSQIERRMPPRIDDVRRDEALAEFGRALDSNSERHDLLHECCGVIARARGYSLVWIGRGEPDGSVSVVGAAGEAIDYLKGLPMRWDDRQEGGGPVGRAIRRREPAVAKVHDASFAPWRERARSFGIRCVAAVPFVAKDDTPHALAAHSNDARQIWGQDLSLLNQFASDLIEIVS